MPVTYENIATFSPTGSNVTFSSIPSTYTDLRLVIAGSFSASDRVQIRLNGNTSAIYSHTRIQGDGANATSAGGSGGSFFIQPTTATTSPFLCEMNFFSYASTSINKTILMATSNDQNGSGVVERMVCLFGSTSAITSIELQTRDFNNYSSGTTATLYGIKNA
jgi:hypothetical protein